jgi:hypothetical protein
MMTAPKASKLYREDVSNLPLRLEVSGQKPLETTLNSNTKRMRDLRQMVVTEPGYPAS